MPILVLAWTLLALPAFAADDPEGLVADALGANPELEARRARVDELAALEGVSRAWPDPMLGVEVSNLPVDSFRFDAHPMAGVQLRVQQRIPEPLSRKRSGEAAAARVRASEEAVAEAELSLERAVRVTWWRLALNRQLQEVFERHVDVTDEMIAAIRARYEVGATGQSSVIRFELLRDRLAEDLADLRRADAELVAALRRTLADPGRTFDTPGEVEPLAVPGDLAEWVEIAADTRPLLRQLDAEIATAEAEAAMARASAAPDLTLWAGYRIRVPQQSGDPGVDFFTVGAMVPIPVASAHVGSGRREAALEAARGAEARKAAQLDRIRADLEAVHARWSRSADKAVTYGQDLLPDAQRALDTTFSDYRVGKTDFGSLYQAEVQLLELERTTRTATIDTHVQEAEARAAIGAPAGGTP